MKKRKCNIIWMFGDDSHLPIVKEINKASDRATAVLAVAFIEERLTTLIKARLAGDEKVKEGLFAPTGGCGSFAIKVDLGHLLGLYDGVTRKDLKTLAHIRNVFAHQTQAMKFTSAVPTEMCSKLQLARRIPAMVVDTEINTGFKKPRDQFLFTVTCILNTVPFIPVSGGRRPGPSPSLRKS